MLKKLLVLVCVVALQLSIAKDLEKNENNSSLDLNSKGKEYFAQKLAQIIKMTIAEITMHNRSTKDRGDLTKVSMMLGFFVKKKQAMKVTPSDTPNSGARKKVELYDSSLKDRNLCAVYDSDDNYLFVDIKQNGDVCKLVAKYIKSNKYTLLK